VISEHDYAKAKDDLAAAQINYDNATANTALDKQGLDFDVQTKEAQVKRESLLVADLKRRYDDLTLRSPVDGMVGNIAVQPRTNVTPNQAIMTVVDLTQMEIEVQIPETYADGLALGMGTEISYGGNTYPGRLTAVSPEVQNNLVTGRVRFAGAPPKGMKQNSQVQVRIVMDSRPDVLMVQRGQFLDSGGGNVAYLVHDGIATRTPIHTGAASISQVEILDGLKEGDSIIISDTSGFDTANTVYLK
jgi:HlyD family secretion protein